jgi:hypothetical protein
MLLPLRFWAIAVVAPQTWFRGAELHRAGLQAAAAGDPDLADRLFECAAARYREDLAVPALARLRVHQMMVRAEGAFARDMDTAFEFGPEIERRLLALERIEDLAPPFAEIPAEDLLARWSARFRMEPRRQAA